MGRSGIAAAVGAALALGSGCGSACPSGDCSEGTDGGPAVTMCRVAGNLAYNPGFECGVDGWVIADAIEAGAVSASAAARTGGGAALVTATRAASAVSLWTKDDPIVNPGTRTFCARAWMRGGSDADTNGWLTLSKVSAGSRQDVNFAMPLTTDWAIVPPPTTGPLEVVGNGEDRILLRIWINDPLVGQRLFVDDVQLWEAASGSCKG